MKIAIALDAGAEHAPSSFEMGAAEAEAVLAVVGTARDVEGALVSLGHEVVRATLPETPDALFRALGALSVDCIVNLVESHRGRADLESSIAHLFELAEVPFTGSSGRALSLALEKPIARAVLLAEGVRVPLGVRVRGGRAATIERWPVIAKPSAQDASHGIDDRSVCADADALATQLARLAARGIDDVLVEEYVAGRELNVSLVARPDGGLEALPIAEIDYRALPPGRTPILTFEAKWDPSSVLYQATPSIRAELPASLAAEVTALAVRAAEALGLRGYARIDFRVDAHDRPYVIDVNPNPDLSRDAGFALALERGGRRYEDGIRAIVDEACAR